MQPPIGSPALWVRLTHRFGPRQTEWLMATITLMAGVVLLLPARTFDNPAYTIFAVLLPEWVWGVILSVLGVGRFAGLIINGTRPRVTPTIRVVAASVGLFIWVGMTTGTALSGFVGLWLAFYPAFVLAEGINIVRASKDHEESNGKNGRTSIS